MHKVSEVTNNIFTLQTEPQSELAASEWRPLQRGGQWSGRISLQCPKGFDLVKLFKSVDGRIVCCDGVAKTLAVSSPVQDSLAATAFNTLIQSQ